MNLELLMKTIKNSPELIDFNDLIEVIDQNYIFTPTAFQNGDLRNQADENNGSCKLFYFARLQGLNEDETLACFGAYYRDDVLNNPDSDNHQNIRNFMQTGWDGVSFDGEALIAR